MDGRPCLRNKRVLVCKACSAREALEDTGMVEVFRGLAYWLLPETSIALVLLSDRLLLLSDTGVLAEFPLESLWAKLCLIEKSKTLGEREEKGVGGEGATEGGGEAGGRTTAQIILVTPEKRLRLEAPNQKIGGNFHEVGCRATR